MKSVGEAMAIGRTFGQAFAKALRSRELDKPPRFGRSRRASCSRACSSAAPERFEAILELFRRGVELEAVHERTAIDPWFLRELHALAHDPERAFAGERTFKAVDTCAAEFPAHHPLLLLGVGAPRRREGAPAHEVRRGERPSVVILGAGPNRIGQGIEFDYCCVHAAMTVRESGRDAVMINCNPETVSTDYDTSDRLYFEPLTLEDVLGVVEVEQPEGVIVQFGGQTPLKLAAGLAAAGVPLLGTSVEAIDLAEDRGRFGELLGRLGYQAPPYATARSVEEALQRGEEVGYPLLVRPSYVLGGRAMEIVYSPEGLADYLRRELPAEERDERDRAAPAGRRACTCPRRGCARRTRPPRSRHVARRRRRTLRDHAGRDPRSSKKRHDLLPRPLPGERDRGGRRRAVRREGGVDRGHHAARRGGRRALRGLRLRAAAALAGGRDARADPRRHARARAERSASSACSTCSTPWWTGSCTCWRPTRAPRAPCRSSPRPSACRWRSSRAA